MQCTVEAVCLSAAHTMSKPPAPFIRLLAGLGVEGDAHQGVRVQHRSRVAQDPTQPNLRQLHLMAAELHEELQGRGFRVQAGSMGENVVTRGLIRRAGIMAVVRAGGEVRPGDAVRVELPPLPHLPLERV